MAKLGDERVAMIAEYASNYSKLTDAWPRSSPARRSILEARRQAVKAKWLRPTQGRAVAADGPARPPGRAPAAAADRPADLGCAADRQVREKARDEYSNALNGLRRDRRRGRRLALSRPGPAAIGQGRSRACSSAATASLSACSWTAAGVRVRLEDAVAVEFSARKPAPSPTANARRRTEPGRGAEARDGARGHGTERPTHTGDRRRRLAGGTDIQGDRGRSGDDRRLDRDSARRVGDGASRPGAAVGQDEGQRQDLAEAQLHRVWRHECTRS